jgi:hypothetical protein
MIRCRQSQSSDDNTNSPIVVYDLLHRRCRSASVVVDILLPTPQSGDFQDEYAATSDRLLDPEELGKIVGARDMLFLSKE